MPKRKWKHEGIIDRLRQLIEVDKVSFADATETINAEFGTSFTRMALIGQARRKGVKVPPERVNSPKGTRKPRKRGDAGGSFIQFLGTRRARPEPFPVIVDSDIPLEQRKTILELNDETCRWPIGEGASMFFCGAEPLDGKPYCGAHCARAYTNHARGWERPDSSARLRRMNGNLSALGSFDNEAA